MYNIMVFYIFRFIDTAHIPLEHVHITYTVRTVAIQLDLPPIGIHVCPCASGIQLERLKRSGVTAIGRRTVWVTRDRLQAPDTKGS